MKPGRNDTCPCGSGKKYKKCCQGTSHAKTQREHVPAQAVPVTGLTPIEFSQMAVLFSAGRYLELENRTRSLLGQYPDSGFVWKVLATALQRQGKDALSAMQKAAALLPEDAEVHISLGNALQTLGRHDEAVASYRRSLSIKSDSADIYVLLGNALKELRRLDDAVASYRRALIIRPDYAEVHSNLGNALTDLGRLDDAVSSYRRAVALKPDYAEAHSNLGSALTDVGQLDDAMASCRRALAINPDFAQAHSNLGNALTGLGRLNEALACYRRALEIEPGHAKAHSDVGTALKDLGRFDEAVTSYRRALEIDADYADAHSNLLFAHNFLSDQPAEMLLDEALRFGKLVARQAHPFVHLQDFSASGRRLRVGLVSGDLRNHPVGYFVGSMLAALASSAASRMDIIAYPSYFRADALTQRIKACCRGWYSAVGLSDENLAQRIRDDGIDVLIDLSGHTAHNRLPMFAWKPAPVQVSWLGYFATTGVAEMDYLIADPWTVPPSEALHFSEKVWRLPETYLCFTPPDVNVQIASLPALANGYVTFGCFNNLTKMNDEVVALWSRVLLAVPESRLFLKTRQLDEEAVRKSVIERFAAQGIDAGRLILEGAVPRAELIASYNRVDIALDPFPYPGGTTTVEGLWMGVPAITRRGDRFLSRVGESIAHNAGLSDWIAVNDEDYVVKAACFAANLEALAGLRAGLRQQALAAPLFDASRFAQHFEEALWGMWNKYQEQR